MAVEAYIPRDRGLFDSVIPMLIKLENPRFTGSATLGKHTSHCLRQGSFIPGRTPWETILIFLQSGLDQLLVGLLSLYGKGGGLYSSTCTSSCDSVEPLLVLLLFKNCPLNLL